MADSSPAHHVAQSVARAPHGISVARMQQIDTAAIETCGIPRLLLMEHAGLAVAQVVRTLLPRGLEKLLVCCGMGFNGGDGLAAARHLAAWGYGLTLVLAGRLEQLRDEPAIYANMLRRAQHPLTEVTDRASIRQIAPRAAACDLIIDALLGMGASGDVREPMASLIAWMNQTGKPIVAVDVPSGLDADTGQVQGVAVRATTTVTFGLAKQGLFLNDGPSHAGAVVVEAITMPRHLLTG